MNKTISLCDYVALIYDGKEEKLSNNPQDLWKALGWDIINDKNASECADIVIRDLFCFGRCDLSPLTNGHTLIVEFRFN